LQLVANIKFTTINCCEIQRLTKFGEKAPIWLLLEAIGTLKFGFGTLLLFRLLPETLANNLGNLQRLWHSSFSYYNITGD